MSWLEMQRTALSYNEHEYKQSVLAVGGTFYYSGNATYNGLKVYDAGQLSDGALASSVFAIPRTFIHSIAATIFGDGVIEFSYDPLELLEDTSFIAWNGVDTISLAVTAFRVKRLSGLVYVTVIVK